MLFRSRYDFKFVDISLLDDYETVRDEIKGYRSPTARLVADKLILDNISSSLSEYWQEHVQNKPLLQQVDALKNFQIKTSGITVPAQTIIGDKIAHNNNHMLWIDSTTFTKKEVVKGLMELNCFPLVMPVSGEIHAEEEVKEFWEWLNAFKAHGIDILNQCSWGFDVREPIYRKDVDDYNERKYLVDNQKPREFFENLFELHQMSKQFKFINDNTKLIFVRNRIPRSVIKSKIQIKASLIALGGGYYASGTENLKRLLENLPKKLYYSNHQPSSFDWNDRVIVKL